MPYKKPVIHISGLIAGLLLFLSLLAVQFNNVFFNSSFQTTAIDKLSIYERIIAPDDQSMLKSSDEPLLAAVKNSVTPDLFNKNVKSLIDGLIDYVSGRTDNLPDLYVVGADKLSITASAGVTPAAVEKINLQLVMMFSTEQNYSDILSVISLLQFILTYLPVFLLLFLVAVVAAVSRKSPSEILDWMHITALTYFILCWLGALLIGSTPRLIPFSGISGSAAVGILKDYIRYCSGSISWGILLSGLALLAGMESALYFYRRFSERFNERSNGRFSIPFPNKTISTLLATTAVYSLLTFVLVSDIYSQFHKRDLGHAVSYIMGSISYNRYTDARNEDVCLLSIKVLNENDKKPFQNIQAAIYPLDTKGGGKAEKDKETVPGKTGKDGTVSFLLSEGEFRLELNTSGLSGYEGQAVTTPLSYDFSLATPGRTDLAITLGSDPGTSNVSSDISTSSTSSTSSDLGMPLLKIVDASMQYMP